jgi:cyclic pyranopterin phosphate synthase
MDDDLGRLDERPITRTLDVIHKVPTSRRALVAGSVALPPSATEALRSEDRAVLEDARIAALSAAKWTSVLIPACHPIHVDDVEVWLAATDTGVDAYVRVRAFDRSGPEMEALVACSTALLCVVAAYRHVVPSPTIEQVVVLEKSGGSLGNWSRHAPGRIEGGIDQAEPGPSP